MTALSVRDLHVSVGGSEIVRGVSLEVAPGEVHVVMGPNGSGKSTLAHALAGRPGYDVTGGSIEVNGVDVTAMAPAERARAGLFLALQQPLEVPGVLIEDVLVAAGHERGAVRASLAAEADRLELDADLLARFVNVDLSGGERKRAEIVQLGVLRPSVAVLDEVDSGLDVDALRVVARRLQDAVNEWRCGVLAITHFTRLLAELPATRIHVLDRGVIVASGGPELATTLEHSGYEPYRTMGEGADAAT